MPHVVPLCSVRRDETCDGTQEPESEDTGSPFGPDLLRRGSYTVRGRPGEQESTNPLDGNIRNWGRWT